MCQLLPQKRKSLGVLQHSKGKPNILNFINQSDFLPAGVQLKEVTSRAIVFRDANGVDVSVGELSDGYRSILEEGDVALIDPRRENPLDFLILDLRNTFEFTPIADTGAIEFERTEYTIEVLRLNERDYLINARENALSGYRARLVEHVQLRQDDAPNTEITRVKRGIQRAPHPTVWAEMKRQHSHQPALADLFGHAPEALDF